MSNRSLWSDGLGLVLLSISAGWVLSTGNRFTYPNLVPILQAEFGIGLTTIGLLLSVLWGCYALGHVLGGFLGDWLGEGNLLTMSASVATVTVSRLC